MITVPGWLNTVEAATWIRDDLNGYQVGYGGSEWIESSLEESTPEQIDHARRVLMRLVSFATITTEKGA